MDSDKFVKLYNKSSLDESITPFKDIVGFALVRKYKYGSEYDKDGRRIFTKLYLTGNTLNGSAEMVQPNKDRPDSYILVAEPKYKKSNKFLIWN